MTEKRRRSVMVPFMTSIQRLVNEHIQGTAPTECILDTPQKIRDFFQRMREATRDEMLANRKRRAMSALKARTRIVS